MGRAYVRVSPEVLIQLLKQPVYVQQEDGTFHRITADLPADAKAVRAWPAYTMAIGQEGDICCSFDSEKITNTPGEMMQDYPATVIRESGYSFVRDDGAVEE